LDAFQADKTAIEEDLSCAESDKGTLTKQITDIDRTIHGGKDALLPPLRSWNDDRDVMCEPLFEKYVAEEEMEFMKAQLAAKGCSTPDALRNFIAKHHAQPLVNILDAIKADDDHECSNCRTVEEHDSDNDDILSNDVATSVQRQVSLSLMDTGVCAADLASRIFSNKQLQQMLSEAGKDIIVQVTPAFTESVRPASSLAGPVHDINVEDSDDDDGEENIGADGRSHVESGVSSTMTGRDEECCSNLAVNGSPLDRTPSLRMSGINTNNVSASLPCDESMQFPVKVSQQLPSAIFVQSSSLLPEVKESPTNGSDNPDSDDDDAHMAPDVLAVAATETTPTLRPLSVGRMSTDHLNIPVGSKGQARSQQFKFREIPRESNIDIDSDEDPAFVLPLIRQV
jgi:hypothetical protein